MRHHTKDKGDSGLGFVIADLLSKNIQVALPISEHLPFDCIIISENNELLRLSVKFRKKNKNGSLYVSYKSCWNDKHGTHIKQQNKMLFDGTAVYCPDTGKCYYIRNDETTKSFSLRLDTPKNNQRDKIKFANDFTNPQRLF